MIRLLSLEEIEEIYENHMQRDFPALEIKPWKMILSMYEQGLYRGYGMFEKGQMNAYSLICYAKGGRYALLDYFAVEPDFRGRGYGSEFLRLLQEACQGEFSGIIIEAENPDFVSEDEKETSIRRIEFYKRNHFYDTKNRCRLFGVEFVIMALPLEVLDTPGVVYHALDKIYRTMIPEELYPENAQLRIER